MADKQPEKIRFLKLRLVCRKALEQSIKKSLSLDQIKSCYPEISLTTEGTKALDTARSQIVQFWFDNSLREFELIFSERDIEAKLDELDELILQAEERRELGEDQLYINDLTPEQLMDANLALLKKMAVTLFLMIHEQLHLDNEELLKSLKDLEVEINTTRSDIELRTRGILDGLRSVSAEEVEARAKLEK